MPWIEITISPSGQTQAQTRGFLGTTCRAGSAFIERALGAAVHERLTPEFYEPQVSSATTQTEPC